MKKTKTDKVKTGEKRAFLLTRNNTPIFILSIFILVSVITLFFMENPEAAGLFNCGTGKARSWNDLANAVFTAMNKKPNIKYIEMPDHLKNQYQYHTEADMQKLKAAGYAKPFQSLEDGIRDYVQQHLT